MNTKVQIDGKEDPENIAGTDIELREEFMDNAGVTIIVGDKNWQ